ncbi:MAG: bifunctional pyr operon transcriptional regulator/uracil phosphoribosyltransferase PyrR [Acidobacteria bacterium]|nr:bifunctional pyr operon transcriptional regulator/uracil phosphoribosyltransferase PyrR [Acidobacteriota bacterium]
MTASNGICQLDAAQMEATLQRLAGEILQSLEGQGQLVLLGIRSRGLPLAERMGELLRAASGQPVPVGALDITLYRDDLTEKAGTPIVRPTEIPFSLKERTVLLVDDVIFTGRTVRAALDALLDHGRPRSVRLAVLVDRTGRELPIQPDFTGIRVEVKRTERIAVHVAERDGDDGVFLEQLP